MKNASGVWHNHTWYTLHFLVMQVLSRQLCAVFLSTILAKRSSGTSYFCNCELTCFVSFGTFTAVLTWGHEDSPCEHVSLFLQSRYYFVLSLWLYRHRLLELKVLVGNSHPTHYGFIVVTLWFLIFFKLLTMYCLDIHCNKRICSHQNKKTLL